MQALYSEAAISDLGDKLEEGAEVSGSLCGPAVGHDQTLYPERQLLPECLKVVRTRGVDVSMAAYEMGRRHLPWLCSMRSAGGWVGFTGGTGA